MRVNVFLYIIFLLKLTSCRKESEIKNAIYYCNVKLENAYYDEIENYYVYASHDKKKQEIKFYKFLYGSPRHDNNLLHESEPFLLIKTNEDKSYYRNFKCYCYWQINQPCACYFFSYLSTRTHKGKIKLFFVNVYNLVTHPNSNQIVDSSIYMSYTLSYCPDLTIKQKILNKKF